LTDKGFSHPVFSSYLDWYTALGQFDDPSNTNYGKVTPQKPYVGMRVYADGVNLNFGSGAGFYRWTGTVWQYIG
jgi:hypothetical protein